MEEATEVKKMPSFRIGVMAMYANWDKPQFRPGHLYGGDAFYDLFRDRYWKTREEAEAYLEEVRKSAETEGTWANKNRDIVAKLVVGEWHETPDVCRLNTLLSEETVYGLAKREELQDKMQYFGECEISWSCIGHTRAEWQTQADAEWLKANHPEWEVVTDTYRLFVKTRNGKEG